MPIYTMDDVRMEKK